MEDDELLVCEALGDGCYLRGGEWVGLGSGRLEMKFGSFAN